MHYVLLGINADQLRTIFVTFFPYKLAGFCTKNFQFFLPNFRPSKNHCAGMSSRNVMQIFPLCWHINHDKWSHFYSICKSSEAMNGIEIFFFEHCLKKWKITYNWMIYSICKSKSFCSFIALRDPSVQRGHTYFEEKLLHQLTQGTQDLKWPWSLVFLWKYCL